MRLRFGIILVLLIGILFRVSGHLPVLPKGKITTRLSPFVNTFSYKVDPKSQDTVISSLLNEINGDSIGSFIQHLQVYGTRECVTPQAVLAQNWLRDKLISYGYSVSIQDFPQLTNSSDNVIASLPGNLLPNEYIVIGGHYDSFSGSSDAPGADDNASGTAGVLEIARVLSQHVFDRTIVLCCWSAEEYGLYGSTQYAGLAANAGMNILGYLNLDMCGYLYGTTYRTNVVGSAASQPLLDLYAQVCNMYVPSLDVTIGGSIPGYSDHVSFNNVGYMGIFPFEDVNHYSPYIHSPQDLLGTSVNSLPQAAVFARSVLATALVMAKSVPPPVHLTGFGGTQIMSLSWKNPGIQAQQYNIYRDDMTTVYAITQDTFFLDGNILPGELYEYAVSLVSQQNGQESVLTDPLLLRAVWPYSLPFSDDFENTGMYWMTRDYWDLVHTQYLSADHSMTDSPGGSYSNGASNILYLYPFHLSGCGAASFDFYATWDLELDYDYVFLELSTGDGYQVLDTFTGSQPNWTHQVYDLHDYLGSPWLSIRYRMVSDDFTVADGMYLDDVHINTSGVGMEMVEDQTAKPLVVPNPFTDRTTISFSQEQAGKVSLVLFNSLGETVQVICDKELSAGPYQFVIDGNKLPDGVYYYRLSHATGSTGGMLLLEKK